MTNNFEKFLEKKFMDSSAANGLLDDDFPDAFDNWLEEQDVESMMKFGEEAMSNNLPYVEALEKAVKNATPEIRRKAARDVLDIIQESIPPMYKNHTVVTEILEKAMQNVAKEFSTP